MKKINYISILSQVTGLTEQDIEFMSEVQCISPNEAIEAVKIIIMKRDEELTEKYSRWIKKAEKEMEETEARSRYLFLDGKIIAYKMVLIDLQE